MIEDIMLNTLAYKEAIEYVREKHGMLRFEIKCIIKLKYFTHLFGDDIPFNRYYNFGRISRVENMKKCRWRYFYWYRTNQMLVKKGYIESFTKKGFGATKFFKLSTQGKELMTEIEQAMYDCIETMELNAIDKGQQLNKPNFREIHMPKKYLGESKYTVLDLKGYYVVRRKRNYKNMTWEYYINDQQISVSDTKYDYCATDETGNTYFSKNLVAMHKYAKEGILVHLINDYRTILK